MDFVLNAREESTHHQLNLVSDCDYPKSNMDLVVLYILTTHYRTLLTDSKGNP